MTAFEALGLFLVVFLGTAIFFKVPVAFGLGLGTLALLICNNLPLLGLAQVSFSSLDSFPFMAIPFFIFAGTLMEYSGISHSLLRLVEAFVGKLRGTIGAVTVLGAMAFGVLTGSAMATISAIGKIMIPEMEKKGYRKSYAAALAAATCFLGILIPPSVPGIIYGLAAGAKISDVWLATIGPAIIIGSGYILVNYFMQGRKEPKNTERIGVGSYFKNVGIQTKNAIAALLMPIIIFGGIYGGICTPTEAGALSAVYGLVYYVVKKLINKNSVQSNLWKITVSSAVATAAIAILTVFANAAGRAISLSGVSEALASFVIGNISEAWVFLLLVNIIFLFLGTFMDINAAIMIMTPLLLPSAKALLINPVHFGAIMLVNLCVGFMTPPFAAGIFVACKLSGAKFGDVVRDIMPFIFVGLVAIALTTYWPDMVLFFPKLFGG